jgi:hypothetical protein
MLSDSGDIHLSIFFVVLQNNRKKKGKQKRNKHKPSSKLISQNEGLEARWWANPIHS